MADTSTRTPPPPSTATTLVHHPHINKGTIQGDTLKPFPLYDLLRTPSKMARKKMTILQPHICNFQKIASGSTWTLTQLNASSWQPQLIQTQLNVLHTYIQAQHVNLQKQMLVILSHNKPRTCVGIHLVQSPLGAKPKKKHPQMKPKTKTKQSILNVHNKPYKTKYQGFKCHNKTQHHICILRNLQTRLKITRQNHE